MRETLLVIGLISLAAALRSARNTLVRKLGTVVFLAASFFAFYHISGSLIGGLAGILIWLFLPWVELLTRIRSMRLPVENQLKRRLIPNPALFPHASEASSAMEEEGFDHVSDCGWNWAGMKQFFRLYWHPEERAVTAVVLCEQAGVAFAFISITSHDDAGNIWRSTNFPFAHTLIQPPNVHWNHVPCSECCFHKILQAHRNFLTRSGIEITQLRIPNPEEIETTIEDELRQQVQYNLTKGLIHLTNDGHFRYSRRGLLFLWVQFLKDLLKFC